MNLLEKLRVLLSELLLPKADDNQNMEEEIKQDEENEDTFKCSFCGKNSEVVLTMISDGEITETLFCMDHLSDYKYGEYKFNVENEQDVEYSLIPEFFEIENKKKNSEENFSKKIKSVFDEKKDLLSILKKEMNSFVKKEDFNKAAQVRDKIKTIEEEKNGTC